MKFIVIRPPETEIAKGLYPQHIYNSYVDKLKQIKNVDYKDFSNMDLNYIEDFYDLTHLSEKGMINFTKLFIKELFGY